MEWDSADKRQEGVSTLVDVLYKTIFAKNHIDVFVGISGNGG